VAAAEPTPAKSSAAIATSTKPAPAESSAAVAAATEASATVAAAAAMGKCVASQQCQECRSSQGKYRAAHGKISPKRERQPNAGRPNSNCALAVA
jgi:hypothetical protein